MKFKIGDKVRVKQIQSEEFPDVYYAKIVAFAGDNMTEVWWYSKDNYKSYSHTHFYRYNDLIVFGRRTGHHLTDIFK